MKNKTRLLAFLAGFISLELEIIGTRLLSPVFGQTIYVWTSLISISLLLLAIGYQLGGRLADKGIITIKKLSFLVLLIGCYIILLSPIARFVLRLTYRFGIVLGPLLATFLIFLIPMTLLGFIVPGSIKLLIRSLDKVGSVAGEIYSISTIGSIVGALLTGFYLLFYVGIRSSTKITGVVLILLSLIIFRSKRYLLLILVVPLLLLIPNNLADNIIEEFPSFYNRLIVVGDENTRTLYRTTGALNTLILSENRSTAMYDELYDIAWIYNSSYKDVLFIGLGPGLTVKKLQGKYSLNLEVVEIEPRMIDIAKKYFNWKDDSEVIIDDARHHLRSEGDYDLIIVDPMVGHEQSNLATLEFFEEVHDHLNEDGSFLINVLSPEIGDDALPLQTLYATLSKVFNDILVLKIDPAINPNKGHLLTLYATKKRIDRSELLASASYHILQMKNKNVSFKDILNHSYGFQAVDNIEITTDDKPLIELYSLNNYWEYDRERRLEGALDIYVS